MNEPTEIATITRLIEEGRHEEAVEIARAYEARIRSTTPIDESLPGEQRYHALNALCNALLSAGDIGAAIDTCTRAIELIPSRWVAINSRATAYFASRRFQDAIRDYRRALEVAPDEPTIVDTIEHNIRLTEQRLDAADR